LEIQHLLRGRLGAALAVSPHHTKVSLTIIDLEGSFNKYHHPIGEMQTITIQTRAT
jgi:hypothetical protein